MSVDRFPGIPCATVMAAATPSTPTTVRTSPNCRTAHDPSSATAKTPAAERIAISTGSSRNASRVVPAAVAAIDNRQNRYTVTTAMPSAIARVRWENRSTSHRKPAMVSAPTSDQWNIGIGSHDPRSGR